jgi:hypothetical protein
VKKTTPTHERDRISVDNETEAFEVSRLGDGRQGPAAVALSVTPDRVWLNQIGYFMALPWSDLVFLFAFLL